MSTRKKMPAHGYPGVAEAGARFQAAPFGGLLGADGVDVERTAEVFNMTKGQLAETVGLAADTLQKAARRNAPKTQARVTELIEIITRLEAWAGGRTQAMAWYRAQPIAALDGRTAEALVKSGKAGLVRDYLDHLALGGFA
ncbi:antitoxin Xre/MbcA/ParS toxin-binding domain-containing protein [Caulobacter sp. NIBR1757]|uniref:antitoxin Xre/MbcA/ParS toxin-binding domain-containing protein n=1 Tax=Caulobacter sp. NIBR1757 TaxID=3016000 RepID=UPI0022F023DD|nr:antitoxin Xre/MbcA/ParS toxin-binding domain-containing protein [Caulobacter sp. NIBR1757]WGM40880.1 hypothetical protein AMEJIAPC_03827 [Caulobacter sp. NIBR1757]